MHVSVSVWFGHAGVVAPSLMLGGIFGRLIAALLPTMCIEYLAPDGDFGQYIARLAIVGATCFCGAVCRVHGSAFVLGSVKACEMNLRVTRSLKMLQILEIRDINDIIRCYLYWSYFGLNMLLFIDCYDCY